MSRTRRKAGFAFLEPIMARFRPVSAMFSAHLIQAPRFASWVGDYRHAGGVIILDGKTGQLRITDGKGNCLGYFSRPQRTVLAA